MNKCKFCDFGNNGSPSYASINFCPMCGKRLNYKIPDREDLIDLIHELTVLTYLYPGLHKQLESIEKTYNLKYGFEKQRVGFVNHLYEVEINRLEKKRKRKNSHDIESISNKWSHSDNQ